MAAAEDASITIRVPSALKVAAEQVATTRGMTLTGVVRQALEDFVSPPQRVFELPGLSQAFNVFLDESLAKYGGRALLLVVDDGGHRAVYPGYINANLVNASLVGIRVVRQGGAITDPAWPILRKNIVGWYAGPENFFNGELIQVLGDRGWPVIGYGPR